MKLVGHEARPAPFWILVRRDLALLGRTSTLSWIRFALTALGIYWIHDRLLSTSWGVGPTARYGLAVGIVQLVFEAVAVFGVVAPPILGAQVVIRDRDRGRPDLLRLAGASEQRWAWAWLVAIALLLASTLLALVPLIAFMSLVAPVTSRMIAPLLLMPFTWGAAGAAAGMLVGSYSRTLPAAMVRYSAFFVAVPFGVQTLLGGHGPHGDPSGATTVFASACTGVWLGAVVLLARAGHRRAIVPTTALVAFVALAGFGSLVEQRITFFSSLGVPPSLIGLASIVPLATPLFHARTASPGGYLPSHEIDRFWLVSSLVSVVAVLIYVRLTSLVAGTVGPRGARTVTELRTRGKPLVLEKRWGRLEHGNPVSWRVDRLGVGLAGGRRAHLVVVAALVCLQLFLEGLTRFLAAESLTPEDAVMVARNTAVALLYAGPVLTTLAAIGAFTGEREGRTLEILGTTLVPGSEVIAGKLVPGIRLALLLATPLVTHAIVQAVRGEPLPAEWVVAVVGVAVSAVAASYVTLTASLVFPTALGSLLAPAAIAIAYGWLPALAGVDVGNATYPLQLPFLLFESTPTPIPAHTYLHMAALAMVAAALHSLASGPLLRRAIERGGR